MDSIDINWKQYKKVFEFIKTYKKSFVKIEIAQFENQFFFGINYRFNVPPFFSGGAFSPLRKWGTYPSLAECKKAAIKNVNESACSEREKALLNKLNLQDIFTRTKDREHGKKTDKNC